jgi:hypothetical protein
MPGHDTSAWDQVVQPAGWGTRRELGVQSNGGLLLLFSHGEGLMV